MIVCLLTLASASIKSLALLIGNDMNTAILITLGAMLLLVGTILRYKFRLKKEDSSTVPYIMWPKAVPSTNPMGSAAGTADATSLSFASTLERQNDRRAIGHLAIQSTPTTERRANLV